jgi:dimethylglycine dehydrogenase
MHSTGGFYLASNEDWHDYLKRERSKARYMGLDQEFISVEEAARRHPLIDPSRYIAALWDPLDGDIDPSGVTYAYAKAAKHYGAAYHTQTPVIETNQRPDGSWDVVTPKGTINAEMVVNAGGLWAREVGHLAGLDLPVQPMEHHFLITEAIPEIVERGPDARLPAGIDYEGNMYFRQEGQGMLLGTYEPSSTPWMVGGTPGDFGHELLPPDLDRIAERLELGFERIPALGRAGIKDMINGPFTFGPDGNPMIGPVPGMRNYWVAVAVMAGFCQAGGVGLCLAEWMMEGEPSIDVWAMDIARFGDYATADYGTVKSSENYERRFVMTFPNETLPKGRRQKTTALYDRLVARGAVMGDAFGLESVLWFANGPEDAHEEPTFKRSRAHDYVAQEVTAVREAVGAVEVANFAKHAFTGPGARAFLDRVLAGRMPKPGRLNLTPVLSPKGKLHGHAPALVRAPPAGQRRHLPQPLRRAARDGHLGAQVARAPVAHLPPRRLGRGAQVPGHPPDLRRRRAGHPGPGLLLGRARLRDLLRAPSGSGSTGREPSCRSGWRRTGAPGCSTSGRISRRASPASTPSSTGTRTSSGKKRRWPSASGDPRRGSSPWWSRPTTSTSPTTRRS